MTKDLQSLLSKQSIEEIDKWINKYPADQKQSAVMSALMITQEEKGYLTTEWMDAVADYLEMPKIAVYEVATFYSMYDRQPQGKHKINVCTNISCKLRKSSQMMTHLKEKLGVELGEVTQDGNFSLHEVECLGACVGAPMMQVDKEYFENLTPEKIDTILEQFK